DEAARSEASGRPCSTARAPAVRRELDRPPQPPAGLLQDLARRLRIASMEQQYGQLDVALRLPESSLGFLFAPGGQERDHCGLALAQLHVGGLHIDHQAAID